MLNFDQAPYDSSHTWGTAHSFRRASESIVSGRVYDFRVDVGLDTALYAADLIGNCSYSCGFWMERFYNESENDPDTAYVVNADGATEDYSWYEIPINPNSIVCSWAPNSNDDPIHSAIGNYDAGYRHLWFSLNEMDYNYNPGDVQIGSSSGTIICVDAIDGIAVCAEIVGSSWYPAPMGVFNGDHILDVDCIGDNIAMVYFWDATGIESGYVDSVLVEVDDNTRNIIVAEAGSSTIEQDNIYPNQENIGSVSLLNNPVNDVISICTKSIHGEHLTLEVYDLSGRVIYHHNQQVEENVANIDISAYPSGIYILRASIGESTSSVKVIIAK